MSYELNAGGKQLAEVIEKVTWSGDSKQVARKLVFTVANKDSDRFLPKVNINEGDQVQFLEDGKLLFSGPVFTAHRRANCKAGRRGRGSCGKGKQHLPFG